MKILHINKFYYPRGGTERYMFALAHRLEERGHAVIPFAMAHPSNLPSPYANFFVSEVDTRASTMSAAGMRVALRVLWSREAAQNMERLIQETRPDIAHVHLLYHHLSPSLLPVLKKYNIPIVMTLHDYKLICPNYILYTEGSPCARCRGGRFYEATLHRCLKDSYAASALASTELYLHHALRVYEQSIDLLIAPSQFVRDTFVKFGQDGTRIRVLPHFLPLVPVERHTKEESIILYVGRLSKEKGVDKFLKSVYNIPSPWKVVIVGTGPEEQQLRATAQLMQGGCEIEFVGYQAGEALAEWYARAAIVVVPSVFHEPFGLVVLEAFAYGKPVIVSNRGALPELVDHNETGLVLPADDAAAWNAALLAMIAAPRDRARMGKNGRKAVEILYTPEIHLQKLIGWYEELIEEKLRNSTATVARN